MTIEVQGVVFPRAVDGREGYTVAQAQAWSSLHGFDHGDAAARGAWIRIDHRPARAFDASSLHLIRLGRDEDGIRAIVGERVRAVTPASASIAYLTTARQREVYEEHSAFLRYLAILGATNVSLGADAEQNTDLVRWYRAWFRRTHRGATTNELAVEDAIANGLGQASREHALEYVRKLGGRTLYDA